MRLFEFSKVIPIIVCLIFAQNTIGQMISSVEFSGFNKTKSSFLERHLKISKWIEYDQILIEEDIQKLYNLNYYFDVKVDTVINEDGIGVKFSAKEKITILPMLNFGGIKDNFWIQLGAMDVHFLGKGAILGGLYTYYDRHSFIVFTEIPNIGNSKFGIKSSFQKYSSFEPVYFRNQSADYNYDNTTLELLGIYNFEFGNNLYAGLTYLDETYTKLTNDDFLPEVPRVFETEKWILKLNYEWNQVDYYSNYVDGFHFSSFFETVITPGNENAFWKFLGIFRYYKRMANDHNFAFRLRGGISPNVESPFVPFVLDSYINIRGSGNKIARGISELVMNWEFRPKIKEYSWGNLQGAFFIDAGTWRPVGGTFSDMWKEKNMSVYTGLGIRVYVKRIYNMILRADYGFNVIHPDSNGPVFGLGQYF